jgi:hypothetical protein
VQKEDEEEVDEDGGGLEEEVKGVSERTHPGRIHCWLLHRERTHFPSLTWFLFMSTSFTVAFTADSITAA